MFKERLKERVVTLPVVVANIVIKVSDEGVISLLASSRDIDLPGLNSVRPPVIVASLHFFKRALWVSSQFRRAVILLKNVLKKDIKRLLVLIGEDEFQRSRFSIT